MDYTSNFYDENNNINNIKITDIFKLDDIDIKKINNYKEKLLNIINNKDNIDG
jgi:hypothetical protein